MSFDDLYYTKTSQASPFNVSPKARPLTLPFIYRAVVGVYPGMTKTSFSSNITDPNRKDFVTDPKRSKTGPGMDSSLHSGKDIKQTLKAASGVVEPGQDDPTGDKIGAGTYDKFHKRAFKYVGGSVEGRPGILEGTNIDPLTKEELEPATQPTKTSMGVTSTVTGGAKMAYGTVTGDEETLERGRWEYYGESRH